ncbi:MAG: DUF72 domain-containing protein [Anaerolineae bacterium]|nr:DUF72 domain-containing protein [Phycisphaerae bacterium]
MNPDLRFGTMGFSYADWSGVFYPKSLKSTDYLSFYARHFTAVELDTTFHAVPPVDRVERWRDETPDDFRFTAKVPKDITHAQIIDRAVPSMMQFLDVMRRFGEKLAVILIQFPPSFGVDQTNRLSTFLKSLPNEPRFAVEFRNSTWFTPATTNLLREHNVALANAEYVGVPRLITPTADFLYIRWIGEHDRFAELDHEQIDVTHRMLWWKDQIELNAPKVRSVYGFFNNDYAGYSIATCNRMKKMLGLRVIPTEDRRQGKLF